MKYNEFLLQKPVFAFRIDHPLDLLPDGKSLPAGSLKRHE
jgi:hypothetical protein